MHASKVLTARISGTSIVVVTINWPISTSKNGIASVVRTFVTIIARNSGRLATKGWGAPIFGTGIVVVTVNLSVEASASRETCIVRTQVIIIAVNRSIVASFDKITNI
jgi:hypothetical protein